MFSVVLKPTIRSVASSPQSVRCFAAAVANDPIQKLFMDKITEYKVKAAKTSDGLVDVDASVKNALKEEMERVKRMYGVKHGEEGKITVKFNEDEFKLDPIRQKEWK